MKYLIASKVIYDTEKGELSCCGSEKTNSKKLTNTANRILQLLIEKPGEVLERNYMLEKVWESAGHTSSSSSLNQYISILRKTLTSFIDIEETIIVVPRTGFFFSPDIDVSVIDNEAPQPAPVAARSMLSTKKVSPKLYILAGAVALLLLMANVWVMIKSDAAYRYPSLTTIDTIGKCVVETYNHDSPKSRKRLLDILASAEPSLKDKCNDTSARIMLYVQPNVMYGSRGRFFYSYCPVDIENAQITYCENHYSFNWEAK